MSPKRGALVAVGWLIAIGWAGAQPVIDITEEIDFDRPESWAMKYFASIALHTGMGVPERLGPGGIAIGFEGGVVPFLDEEERRVGFEGTKVEDLNRTRFFGRIRGSVGLSTNYSLELSYLPPIEIDRVTPNLFAAAIGRPFDLSETWRLGVRGYGQLGTIEGDITCSAEEIEFGPNPFQCMEPSDDELDQFLLGAELTAGFVSGGPLRPHVGVALTYHDLEFQIRAHYSGVVDRTLQMTDGVTVAVTGGLTYVPSERWSVAGELFYSPLSIVRPPSTSSRIEGLLNGRFLVTYRLR